MNRYPLGAPSPEIGRRAQQPLSAKEANIGEDGSEHKRTHQGVHPRFLRIEDLMRRKRQKPGGQKRRLSREHPPPQPVRSDDNTRAGQHRRHPQGRETVAEKRRPELQHDVQKRRMNIAPPLLENESQRLLRDVPRPRFIEPEVARSEMARPQSHRQKKNEPEPQDRHIEPSLHALFDARQNDPHPPHSRIRRIRTSALCPPPPRLFKTGRLSHQPGPSTRSENKTSPPHGHR